MQNAQKEKIMGIKIGESNILMILMGILLILTSVNLYWTANLTNKLTPVIGETDGELRRAQARELPEQPPRMEVGANGNPSIGRENAPVTIVEFSDFRCSFCARGKPTIAQILETYGDQVRLVFRGFPILGPQSQKAAEAAECANEQGKFWEYHDVLFANQRALDDLNNLKQFAANVGLNAAKFNECLDSGRMAAEVEKDSRDGQSYGVSGTPAFFINGILVSGAQPYSVFEQIIEEELSR